MADDFFDSTFADLDRLVHHIARKVCNEHKLNWSEYGEDLCQSGWVGVVRARQRYVPQGYKFTSYAHWFANGDIRREAVRISKRLQGIEALMDYENDLTTEDNIDDRIIYDQLLSSPDGLELLSDELGLRDSTKQGAAIRKEQRVRLKAAYEGTK